MHRRVSYVHANHGEIAGSKFEDVRAVVPAAALGALRGWAKTTKKHMREECSEFGTKFEAVSAIVKFRIRNLKPPRNIAGPAVRQLRQEAGLTQAELVAKLNILSWDLSRETLAKIESQVRWIADFELLKLSSALGVEPGRLLVPPTKRAPRHGK